jgi:hypothetical protein
VTDGTGRPLFEGSAARVGPPDSEKPFHYVGDFSGFRAGGGGFQVRFEAGNLVGESPRFGVGRSILWRLTKPSAVERLRRLRASRANAPDPERWKPPGILEEDGRFYDVAGGWFDAGEGESVSVRLGFRVLWGLLLACTRASGARGEPAAGTAEPDVLAELRWGAAWLKKLFLRYPSSGRCLSRVEPGRAIRLVGENQEREPHMGLLAGYMCARVSEIFADIDLLRRGERFWEEHQKDLAGLDKGDAPASARADARAAMLLSDVALHVATLEPGYLAAAERRAKALLSELEADAKGGRGASRTRPGMSLPAAALAEFAAGLPEHPLTPRAKEAVGGFLDARVEAASAEPFGLVPPSGDPGGEEGATLRAEETWQALAAHRVTGRQAYVELAANALNWLLGLNPEGSCLFAGGGRESAPPGTGTVGAYLMALSLV